MAAPMENTANTRRKFCKKLNKVKETLKSKEKIQFVEECSNIICVSNGGLDNNVSSEEIKDLFTEFGGECGVLMLPQKSYCYVSFRNIEDAQHAHNALNGFKLPAVQHRKHEVVLYTLFVSAVPDSVCPSTERPPGLILLEDYITEAEAADILASVNWISSDSLRSELKHRRVKHYGYEFKYSINNVDPEEPLAEGIPDVYQTLLKKLQGSGIIKHYPDQLTVNEYQPGQGIPPHVDTPSAFEDGIVSLSLGSQVLMEFRHPDGRHLSVLLPHRSVLVMTGESRYVWSHGITPRKSDIVPLPDGGLTLSHRDVRTSFTFRKITGVKPQDDRGTSKTSLPTDDNTAAELEKLHVYQVYEEIADHFSGTRHTPWPHIAEFLRQQAPGSLLVDIGCGNGKYFGINKHVYELGSDRSFNLAKICHERNFEIYVGDVLAIPLREGVFDVCLCIAVIHHLSTQERRKRAISELLKVLRPGGKALIYVWAVEQELNKVKSKYLKHKLPDPEGSADSDVLNSVQEELQPKASGCDNGSCSVAFKDSGENYSDCAKNNSENNGTESSDLNVTEQQHNGNRTLEVHINRTKFKQQDVLVPWQLKNKTSGATCGGKSSPETFHRFYHVFQKGELESLCESVGLCKVVHSYYDQGNWAVVLEKT